MTSSLAHTLLESFDTNLLRKWYPLVIDREEGGFFTNVNHDWTLDVRQEKMIVTQARHIWTLSKAAGFLEGADEYELFARHGFRFLRERMWDATFGGFYQIRSRNGGMSDVRGWRDEKRTYGNAFGVYALAALYERTGDPDVLAFAREAFHWIEGHAYDPRFRGYFEFITREGLPFDRSSAYRTTAADANELGYKDQNSSIHLLEAYTELYHVWRDGRLRGQLEDLLALIRDTMVHSKGYLQLFFQPDWTPVSFSNADPEVRKANYGLDHVSFGHDYETAFLMLEASYALGLEGDARTLAVAKRMLDHAMDNGWDEERGGFYDGGYYFSDDARCSILRDTKNWWAQAEALNALLLFSRIFPHESRYREYFHRQWEYVNTFVLDHEGGDWFEGGIDREPEFSSGPRSHIWKCTYHTGRALMNCLTLLAEPDGVRLGERFSQRKAEMMEFVNHWRLIGQQSRG